MSHRFAAATMSGTHGLPGILNVRGRSGRFLRMIGIASATSVNAESVPMLTMSESTLMSKHAATSATITPTTICSLAGVPCAPVFDMARGSRPSRLMANTTRVRPSSSTMTTVARPSTIAKLMILAAQSAPTSSNAVASEGLSTLASCL